MKLSKLYCNKEGFKNTTFNLTGLNVIYADVKTKPKERKNSHDLGKTKLAEIIDFLLLKQIDAKRHFLLKEKDEKGISIFIDYIFYLELLLNSGEYLTIRRGIDKHTKISFSLNSKCSDGYIPPQSWTYEDVALTKSKNILADLLDLNFFYGKNYNYRKAINYSLRSQEDYKDVYKLSKYVGKDIDWKPFMFDLLGFDGDLLYRKYANDEQREEITKYIDLLIAEHSAEPENRDDIVAQMQLIQNKYNEVEEQIDQFNFYEQDKELIKNGINTVEANISDLNTQAYTLSFEIDRLRKSISNKFAFDLKKVEKVFNEAEIYFPNQLAEDYKALKRFNEQLTIERNKLLLETLINKEKELQIVNVNLQDFNQQKEHLLSNLRETDVFKKFKTYQKELTKIESHLVLLKNKLKAIDLIIDKEKERDNLLKDVEGTINDIRNVFQHTENNEKYAHIRRNFTNFYHRVMDEAVRISWTINSNNNIEFTPPKVQSISKIRKDTAKDEGNTYRKILCVSFDLAILCTYSQESYFRFVYHDDVLSQQDNGIKLRLLELVRDLTKRCNLQYILSVIKSDLPVDDKEQPIHFSDKEIVLRLNDKDASGTLFGFEF
ncbi:DUF2326 domain-containing protein [Pontibacter burrus]|uniref:DUF2326 domain-containing protein n=1 Tax=Pontibacter burrus TaxID=2704466 RepID=A0A6B3LWY5_9BACT|nr:DUF2326 domain-containing protein [Pontibacter burrus]NEM99455.1 DUF2326 domain-containing protein [Pontibacter burrus]